MSESLRLCTKKCGRRNSRRHNCNAVGRKSVRRKERQWLKESDAVVIVETTSGLNLSMAFNVIAKLTAAGSDTSKPLRAGVAGGRRITLLTEKGKTHEMPVLQREKSISQKNMAC